jgi:hypothetical protein
MMMTTTTTTMMMMMMMMMVGRDNGNRNCNFKVGMGEKSAAVIKMNMNKSIKKALPSV